MDTQITAPHESRVVKSDVVTGSTIPESGSTIPEAKKAAEGLKEKAGQVASRVTGEIREETAKRAKGFLRGQKEHLAEELHKTAEVFRESGERFQEREQGTAAKYVNQIAAQADRFSKYLSERDLDQLAAEMQDVARRSPMLFLVSAFTSGFIMSRFLRSPGSSETGYAQRQTH
jgi:ABC-type transporter Mla subunit MlaD